MKIENVFYKGLDGIKVENEYISLIILPKLGAKIASLIYKPQNFEVLAQPTLNRYTLAEYGDKFEKYDTSGIDEMYPTIDECVYPYDGYDRKMPDHGELWSIPWKVEVINDEIVCSVSGVNFKYEFERRIKLDKNIIRLNYKVKNTGTCQLYGLWAFHGLVACDDESKILLDAEKVMNVHKSSVYGDVGNIHLFPETYDVIGKKVRVDRIGPRTLEKTEKFYVYGEIKKGEAGLTLNKNKLLYKLLFPKDKIPYLGVWINEGGFKGEYNCALEPSNAFYDSVEIAKEYGKIKPLGVNEEETWYLDIVLEELV
ncbi:hypothetical protein [Thermobrachium celere]|uniref:Galactose mutarotase n=1 Tax=Thermobrachium celere DSM 8682 TaxID=941824 RepID=R7RTR3_9CLOT|nr:hypothetical protein [Thermobrachium celere]CDF58801.1 hypothetical protein TCEL_01020 [Thermobrachium celere DSM 8682]